MPCVKSKSKGERGGRCQDEPCEAHSLSHHLNRGNEYFKSNEFEDAVLYYSRSLAFAPDSAIVLANRAAAQAKLKHFGKAEADA